MSKSHKNSHPSPSRINVRTRRRRRGRRRRRWRSRWRIRGRQRRWLELLLSKRIQSEEKEVAIPLYYIPHLANVSNPYHPSALSISHDFEYTQQ
jgi:hypothetical protein